MVERSRTDTIHEVNLVEPDEGIKVYPDWLAAKNNLVPPHLQGALERYLQDGILPGSFLRAVLENKLKESFEQADDISRAALPDIVHYLYNYVPMAAWGSPERVTEWTTSIRSAKLNSQARRTGDPDNAQLEELREGLQTGGQDG